MSIFLEKELLDFGYKINYIHGDILLIENFVSKDEIDDIFTIINNATEEEWNKEYLENLKYFCLEKFGRDDVENLVAEGKFEVTKNWEDKNLSIHSSEVQRSIYARLNKMVVLADNNLLLSGFSTLQRMQSGVELKSHTDQHTDPSIQYATILYLNDNYNNGEVFFEKIGLELKPSTGSLLIFPGTDEYEHGVRHVGDGPIRYVLVGFIKIKDFYLKNKNDTIDITKDGI